MPGWKKGPHKDPNKVHQEWSAKYVPPILADFYSSAGAPVTQSTVPSSAPGPEPAYRANNDHIGKYMASRHDCVAKLNAEREAESLFRSRSPMAKKQVSEIEPASVVPFPEARPAYESICSSEPAGITKGDCLAAHLMDAVVAQALQDPCSPGWAPSRKKLLKSTYVRPECPARDAINIDVVRQHSEVKPKIAALGFGDSATSTTPTTQISGFSSAAQQPRETFPKPKTFTLGTCSPPRRAAIHPPATASIGAQAMEAELCDSDSSSNEKYPLLSGTLPPFSALNPEGKDLAAELDGKSPRLPQLCPEMDARWWTFLMSPSSAYSQFSPYPPVPPSPRKGGAEDISLGAPRPVTVEGMAGHPLANAMTAQEASPTDGLADGEHDGGTRRPSLGAYNELVSRWRRDSCPDTPTETSTPVLPGSDLDVPGAWLMRDGAPEPIGSETVQEEKAELLSSSEAKPSTGGLGADKTFSGTSSSPPAKTELEFEVPTEGAEDLPQEKFPDVCGARKAAFSEGLVSPVEQPTPLKRRKRSNAADSAPWPPVVKELGNAKETPGPGRNNRDIIRKGEVISAFRSGLSGTDKSQSDHGGESPVSAPEPHQPLPEHPRDNG